MNLEFVPVHVSPPSSSIRLSDDLEGRIFRAAWQSRVADQGLCVLDQQGTRFRVHGDTAVKVHGSQAHGFFHSIQLEWHGFIELDGNRVTVLLLSGRGNERLIWGENMPEITRRQNAAARLIAGRPIVMNTQVRYGILSR